MRRFLCPPPFRRMCAGAAELRLNLDFGKLHAQDAELVFELIRGKGRVFIDDTPAASFQNPKDGMLRVPLFRALHLGRQADRPPLL